MADDEPGSGADQRDGPAPLGDLADRIRSRRSGPADGAEGLSGDEAAAVDLEDLFQAASFEEVESDDLWDALDDEETFGAGIEAGEGPDEHIVPKRQYCENCPKEAFSAPPDVRCTNPGTAIVEYVDIDHVRVRNCPVVAERRALGQRDDGRMTQMTFGSQGSK